MTDVRVAVVLPQLADGGGERFWLTLAPELRRAGLGMDLVAVTETSDRHRDAVARAFDSYQLLGIEGRWHRELPRAFRALHAALDRLRPDAVVSMLNEWSWILAARRARPFRLVLNVHINLTQSWRRLGQPRSWLLRRMYASAHRSADLVLTVSAEQAEAMRRRFGPTPKVVSLPIPLDIERVTSLGGRANGHPWLERSDCVVAAGRLIRQKGFDVLLDALRLTSSDVRLLLLGEGPEERNLRRQRETLDLADRVDILGFEENPFPYLRRAAAFVLPSRWEALPYVVAEATALGTPVVASDCNFGPREIVDHERTGLLVPKEDPPALAGAIDRVLRDTALRDSAASLGPRSARRFAVESVAPRYEACLRRLA